ncbi:MAG TPA: rhodanese-like domain-containing protein [Chitinophagaceae bacterium]
MIKTLKSFFGIGKNTDYAKLIKNGATLIDVRSKREYNFGHITGAINIPLEQLGNNLYRLKDKGRVIIIYCASGMRSSSAKTFLTSQGFTQVYNGGGFSRLQNRL